MKLKLHMKEKVIKSEYIHVEREGEIAIDVQDPTKVQP